MRRPGEWLGHSNLGLWSCTHREASIEPTPQVGTIPGPKALECTTGDIWLFPGETE